MADTFYMLNIVLEELVCTIALCIFLEGVNCIFF